MQQDKIGKTDSCLMGMYGTRWFISTSEQYFFKVSKAFRALRSVCGIINPRTTLKLDSLPVITRRVINSVLIISDESADAKPGLVPVFVGRRRVFLLGWKLYLILSCTVSTLTAPSVNIGTLGKYAQRKLCRIVFIVESFRLKKVHRNTRLLRISHDRQHNTG